jgi:hypothetical protein
MAPINDDDIAASVLTKASALGTQHTSRISDRNR